MKEVSLEGIGKVIVIAIKPQTSLWHIFFRTGGEVPSELSGMYTNEAAAINALGVWHANRPKRMKKATAPTLKATKVES